MKNRRTSTFLATLIFSIMLLSLGCGGPQNTNTAQSTNANADANAADANANAAAALAAPCSGNDVYAKRAAVELAIQTKINSETALKRQQTANIFNFQVIVEPGLSPDELYVYLAGGIGNAGNKFLFHDMMTEIKSLHKLKCVKKVILVPRSAFPLKAAAPPEGFEWFGCDAGTIACPGGICAPDPPGTCPAIVGEPTPTPEPASNSNSGSNKNSSSNSGKPNP